MKRLVFMLCVLLASEAAAQTPASGLQEPEPAREELGAPLYPGAVYIRTSTGLNPYHKTAMYISIDPMRTAEIFFEKKIPDNRKVYFEDETLYMTAFLLKTFSKIPPRPTKDDISKLENEPSIQIYEYNRDDLEILAEFFEKKPEEKHRAEAIRYGRTVILYTYRASERFRSEKNIIGTWIASDRNRADWYGGAITFNDDGSYSLDLTPKNLDAQAAGRAGTDPDNRDAEDIRTALDELNPEAGTYVIMRNHIDLSSDNPVIGTGNKSGLAKVGSSVLTLDLIGFGRITFIRKRVE